VAFRAASRLIFIVLRRAPQIFIVELVLFRLKLSGETIKEREFYRKDERFNTLLQDISKIMIRQKAAPFPLRALRLCGTISRFPAKAQSGKEKQRVFLR
jgi:hypothetical protein